MGPDGDLCHKLPAPKELFHLNGSILPVPGIELLVPIIRRQQLQLFSTFYICHGYFQLQ